MKKGGSDKEFLHSQDLGKRLRSARIVKGLSQSVLANELEVTFQQIQKYEKGLNRISLYKIMVWARITSFPMSYFYDAENSLKVNLNTREDLDFFREFKKLPEATQKRFVGLMKAVNGGGDE